MGYSARRGFTNGSMKMTGAQRQAEMQARIQQMQCGTRGGRLAVFQAQLSRRLPEDTVISGFRKARRAATISLLSPGALVRMLCTGSRCQ